MANHFRSRSSGGAWRRRSRPRRIKRSQQGATPAKLMLPSTGAVLSSSSSTALTPPRSHRHRLSPRSRRGMSPQTASPGVVRSRLVLVWLLLMVAMAGLAGKLIWLQVFQFSTLQAKAQEQYNISIKPFIPRRAITDRRDNVLAVDRQAYILYAHPIGFKDQSLQYKTFVAENVAPILSATPAELTERLTLRDSGIQLATGLSEENASRIRELSQELGIDGLDLYPYQDRVYPYGSLFSHIVGYINFEREGQVGIERSQTDLLSRAVPHLNLQRSADGSLMPEGIPEEFNYHEHLNLKLTVDSRLQRRIRNYLATETPRLTANRSIAIVMDVHTGAIRAMVTDPTYDPHPPHTEDDIPRMVNSAVSHLYEPGSTFKPINVAIALESGRLNVNDIIHDSGRITIGTWSIGNHDYAQQGARGDLTVSDVMKYSSNVGMIRIMQKLDPEQYYDWLEKLDMDAITNVDLPHESPALVKAREQFTGSPVEVATTAFGQGFSLTPLKLLQMQAAIANGGQLVTPHVVDGLFDHEGQRYWTPERPDPTSVFSPETSRIVLDMMETVVADGTGKAAQIPGYRIAGKTGTAQKVGNRGIYEEDVKVTSFMSVFPADQPQFALLVLVDEPQGENTYGGTVAAPIAQEIMRHVIALENIQPTAER